MGLRTDVTRTNGLAPADVPLSDIDLGSWDFWGLDDDIRDRAFTTLHRKAPISINKTIVRDPDAEEDAEHDVTKEPRRHGRQSGQHAADGEQPDRPERDGRKHQRRVLRCRRHCFTSVPRR